MNTARKQVMAKRHIIVVSSSEDEGKCCLEHEHGSSSKSIVRVVASRKKSRSSKKARSLGSDSCEGSKRTATVNFDALVRDFDVIDMCGVTTDTWCANSQELFANKYRPRCVEELAVHRKKIDEVKRWLEGQIRIKEGFYNHVLVLNGPAGVGKSATIHVIANLVGAEICEWRTPTPTLWQEYVHNFSLGIPYNSKMDEFEAFVEKVRKYPLLSLSTEGSKKLAVLLLDDLPLAHARDARERLSKCMQRLVQSSQIPTIIVFTDYSKTDSVDNICHCSATLQSVLEKAGASKIFFNPLTAKSIKKVLYRICKEEKCNVKASYIDHIACSSGGDIRNAITTLELFCRRLDGVHSLPSSVSEGKQDEHYKTSLEAFEKDETLSLFHALGKILYNKRDSADCTALWHDSFILKEGFSRPLLKMDTPEKILSQVPGSAGSVADFLHENVLDFLHDEAVDDAYVVASYLSDSDLLHASAPHWLKGPGAAFVKTESGSTVQLAAASVAARGVLFGNSHQSASRWHPIRRPRLWQVDLSSRSNKDKMMKWMSEAYYMVGSYGLSVMVTEFWPALQGHEYRGQGSIHPGYHLMDCFLLDNTGGMGKNVYNCGIDADEGEDEIEDW